MFEKNKKSTIDKLSDEIKKKAEKMSETLADMKDLHHEKDLMRDLAFAGACRDMASKKKALTIVTALTLTGILILITLTACSGSARDDNTADLQEAPKASFYDPFAGKELADVSRYEAFADQDKETVFVETTVAEVKELMEAKQTFVLFCSFEDCPWCNLLIPYLNDAALDAGMKVGYIDTRSNPEWQSNFDIDDYDVFTELFGEWLETDDDGLLHLYVPDTYFIKDGEVVARHKGVTQGIEDPSQELSPEQIEQIKKDLTAEFASLN